MNYLFITKPPQSPVDDGKYLEIDTFPLLIQAAAIRALFLLLDFQFQL